MTNKFKQEINQNHNDSDDIAAGDVNYKGIFFNEDTEQQYYEAGAHFPFKGLCRILDQLYWKLKPERRGESLAQINNNNSKNLDKNDKSRNKNNNEGIHSNTKNANQNKAKTITNFNLVNNLLYNQINGENGGVNQEKQKEGKIVEGNSNPTIKSRNKNNDMNKNLEFIAKTNIYVKKNIENKQLNYLKDKTKNNYSDKQKPMIFQENQKLTKNNVFRGSLQEGSSLPLKTKLNQTHTTNFFNRGSQGPDRLLESATSAKSHYENNSKVPEINETKPNLSYNLKLNLEKSSSGVKNHPNSKINSFMYSKVKPNPKINNKTSLEVNKLSSNYMYTPDNQTLLNKPNFNQYKSRNMQGFLSKNNTDNYPLFKQLSMTNQTGAKQLISMTKDDISKSSYPHEKPKLVTNNEGLKANKIDPKNLEFKKISSQQRENAKRIDFIKQNTKVNFKEKKLLSILTNEQNSIGSFPKSMQMTKKNKLILNK